MGDPVRKFIRVHLRSFIQDVCRLDLELAISFAWFMPLTSLLLLLAGNGSLLPGSRPYSKVGSVVTLFSGDDYPKKAAKVGMEGRVIAQLIISTSGTVRKCEIIESSGWDILDKKTCKILKKRAKFVPARNQQRKPIEDIFITPPIMWRLDDRHP